jgi:DEAD/DEAH box helicase domain-containing protein
MDKLVIDIETSNTFADVGGQANVADLTVSLVGVYSYRNKRFSSFNEHQLDELTPLFRQCGLLIGFAINRFDIPVLAKHVPFSLLALKRLDLLDEIELAFGRRVSLNILAKTNLGVEKTHEGLEAIRLYAEGNIEELTAYCLNDVRITRDLYELARTQRYLSVPDRTTGELVKVPLSWNEETLPATLF